MFEIELQGEDTVKLSGRLDAAQVDKADSLLSSLDRSVTADLADLDYISSAGIGILVKAYKQLNDAGLTIRFVNAKPRVRNIFHYAGLDRILLID